MNQNDEIKLRNILKEMIRLNIKPNFAALGREYGCDYRTAKVKYYEEQNKEKGIRIYRVELNALLNKVRPVLNNDMILLPHIL